MGTACGDELDLFSSDYGAGAVGEGAKPDREEAERTPREASEAPVLPAQARKGEP